MLQEILLKYFFVPVGFLLAFSFRAWYNNYMSGISYTSPDISNHMLETFARRVYVPVTMAGVAVL